jgi:hypothetical protein
MANWPCRPRAIDRDSRKSPEEPLGQYSASAPGRSDPLRRETVDFATAAPQNRAGHEAVTAVLAFPDPTSAREAALADPTTRRMRTFACCLFYCLRGDDRAIGRSRALDGT